MNMEEQGGWEDIPGGLVDERKEREVAAGKVFICDWETLAVALWAPCGLLTRLRQPASR